MFNKPDDAPDSFIHKLSESEAADLAHEKIVSDYQRALRMLGNPETVLTPKPELESYLDCNGVRCYRPRGEGAQVRHENRVRSEHEKRRHLEAVNQELLALRLDKIDPDWPSRFLSTDQAARFYREELAADNQEPKSRAGRVIYSSGPREEPNEYKDDPVDFDDELEPTDER